MPGTEAPRWRFLITPKWLAWHLIMIGSVYGMLALGDWQLHRAEADAEHGYRAQTMTVWLHTAMVLPK